MILPKNEMSVANTQQTLVEALLPSRASLTFAASASRVKGFGKKEAAFLQNTVLSNHLTGVSRHVDDVDTGALL